MQVLDLQQGDYDDVYTNGTTNASVDSAFRKIQKQSTAFHIWRIENMAIVALPKDQYGTFYDSDCYLIYSASQQGQLSGTDVIPRDVRGVNLEYHIHFWLGSSTTPDKSGVAAYKAVELDNYIGGTAVQHRETQGNESCRFKSYFKNGFKILCGLTGDLNFKPKLYRIKGKRAPITTEIVNVDWSNFSSKDVYVVHTERIIFIWIGRTANATEKLHAIKTAILIKDSSNRDASIVFVDDGYEQTLASHEKAELDKYLPLDKRALSKLHEDGNDEEIEKQKTIIRLYRCSDNNGKYRVAEVKLNPLQQTDLTSEDVFILDHGVHGIWVWVGKKANDKERTEALRNARGFVKKKKYPNNTKVTRVIESFEPLEFKVLFLRWKNTLENGRCFTKPQSTVAKGAKIALTKFDATFMNDRLALAAETQLIDDGTGILKIWRIRKSDAVEIPQEQYGTFYSAECYVILYSYEVNQEKKHVLYSWVGLQTSESEMERAISKMLELNKEIGGKAALARIFQEHESAHFLQLFKGKMIVFKGNWSDCGLDRNTKHATYLLRIRGSTSYSSQAIQVHCKASSLNSNSCFVLKRGKRSYIWCGNNSTGDQREMAKGFVGKDCELILEGKEREQFWDYLGGKTQYSCDKVLVQEVECRLPRMMYCFRRNGSLETEEVFGYQQSDLMPEELVVFDAYQTVYAWIGKMYSNQNSKMILEMVEEYLVMDPAGRNIQIPIFIIQQDNEPPTFKGYFESWDNKLWQEYKSFEQLRLKIEGKVGSNFKEINGTKTECNGNFDQYEKYPLHILKTTNENLPMKIDPLKKELYLTHDDFVSLFKMKYSEFDNLPRWKQQELKKKVGLF